MRPFHPRFMFDVYNHFHISLQISQMSKGNDIDRKVTKYQLEENFEEATKLQREQLKRARAKCGEDSIDVAVASFRLGSILEATSSEEVEPLYRNALNIYIKHRGDAKKIELEFATAEILSSLAKIVSKDPKRSKEADAIHRSSLNVYSNWLDAKKSSEDVRDDDEIIRSLVALDIDNEDMERSDNNTNNSNLSRDEYNRKSSNPTTKKFTRTL